MLIYFVLAVFMLKCQPVSRLKINKIDLLRRNDGFVSHSAVSVKDSKGCVKPSINVETVVRHITTESDWKMKRVKVETKVEACWRQIIYT